MSRSGYSDDCDDNWASIRWRGAVKQAIKGKRGQAFLREALAALDAMPDKKLTTGKLHDTTTGEFCLLGAVGQARGMDNAALEYATRDETAEAFGISYALTVEIMDENDDTWCGLNTPTHRWARMRAWAHQQIKKGAE